MPTVYKTDIIELLKEHGYSTFRIRKEHLLSESTLQAFRKGALVSMSALETVCRLCGCDYCDLISYQADTPQGDI